MGFDDFLALGHIPPLEALCRRAVQSRLRLAGEYDVESRPFENGFQFHRDGEIDVALLDARFAPYNAAVYPPVSCVKDDAHRPCNGKYGHGKGVYAHSERRYKRARHNGE